MRVSRLIVMLLGCVTLAACGGSEGPHDQDKDSHADSEDCAPSDASRWQSLEFRSRDGDIDGFRAGSSGSICAGGALPAGYFSDAAPANSADCDDADRTRWISLAFASRDVDADTFRVNVSGNVCSAATLPAGYFPNDVGDSEPDCDDADAGRWTIAAYVGRDRDLDAHPVAEAGNLCYSAAALPASYVTAVPAQLVDCDDANPARWRLVSVYHDRDGDGVGAGTRLLQCHGALPTVGLSFMGYDPNDDPDDPDAALVSEYELPQTLLIAEQEADDE
jgi:hypothetical protein